MAEDSPWAKLSKKERTKLFIFFLCTILVYVLVGLLIYAIFLIITTKTDELMIDGHNIASSLKSTHGAVPANNNSELATTEEMLNAIAGKKTDSHEETPPHLATDEEMLNAIVGKKIVTPHTELPPATDEGSLVGKNRGYYATDSPSESSPVSFDEMLKAVVANRSGESIGDSSRASTENMIHAITG